MINRMVAQSAEPRVGGSSPSHAELYISMNDNSL